MTLIAKDNTITFSSGRTVYAHHLLVGVPLVVGPSDNMSWSTRDFSEGCDGSFTVKTPETRWGDIEVEDAIELCDAMIEAWRRRREFLAALPSTAGAGDETAGAGDEYDE